MKLKKPGVKMQYLLANNTTLRQKKPTFKKCQLIWGTKPEILKTIKATDSCRYSAAQKDSLISLKMSSLNAQHPDFFTLSAYIRIC